MAIKDLLEPIVAEQLAKFGPGQAGKASQINYNVPLPGAYSWDRIVTLELPNDWYLDGARRAGTSLLTLGVVQGDEGRLTAVNRDRLAQFYRRALPATSRPSLRLVAEVGGDVEPLLRQSPARRETTEREPQAELTGDSVRASLLDRRGVMAEPEDVERQRLRIDSYIERLADMEARVQPADRGRTTITLPMPGIGNSILPVAVDPVAGPAPRFALVETWELRSFLGDYGLGRTLQTFSLLPGERTTITVDTWRSDAATREDATSIFDSSDIAAQTRFTSALTTETGSAFQDQGGWAASVSTSASVGFNVGVVNGQFGMEAGFAANHQEASQRWSSSVSASAAEHASQVNNSRRQAVQASSSTTSASGTTTTTVREISNTNLRRVLNFVFRELNQTYEAYVVLRDIKVAFYNGNPGSVEIVPLPDLGRLIRRHIKEANHEQVARFVLTMCAQRIDAADDLVTTLQVGTNPDGIRYLWNDVTLNGDGSLQFDGDTLASNVRWRFTPGSLSRDDRTVSGAIIDKSSIVLRTDNLVVEALLGQADALDPYASALQALDLQNRQSETLERDAETKRTTDALALVSAQDEKSKIDAWQKIFPDEPDIEVVPVAAVSHGNGSKE